MGEIPSTKLKDISFSLKKYILGNKVLKARVPFVFSISGWSKLNNNNESGHTGTFWQNYTIDVAHMASDELTSHLKALLRYDTVNSSLFHDLFV